MTALALRAVPAVQTPDRWIAPTVAIGIKRRKKPMMDIVPPIIFIILTVIVIIGVADIPNTIAVIVGLVRIGVLRTVVVAVVNSVIVVVIIILVVVAVPGFDRAEIALPALIILNLIAV